MADSKTSIQSAWVQYPNSQLKFQIMEKCPIYKISSGFYWPAATDSNKNKIIWDIDYKRVQRFAKDGTITTWFTRPTIQDVYNGRYGTGCCVKFNSDGSIYINWSDGNTWYYGPLIDGIYEDAYDTYDDTESCERCGSFSCHCGQRDW